MDGRAGTPLHLWIVGGLAVLWNGFGAFDYLMTQTRNEAYLANFTETQRAYFESFPPLLQAGWALGVWGALLGSILLLLRSRHAVSAFLVSLAGLAFTTFWNFFVEPPPPEFQSGAMLAMQAAIWVIALGLLAYALRMRKRGVLR